MSADPLGPVSDDPDVVRDVACDLTASSQTCTPPEPEFDFDVPVEAPSVAAGGGGLGFLLIALLVLALLATVAWLVVLVARQRRAGSDEDEDEDLDEDLDATVAERIVDHDRPPARWRRAAGEHRSAGRWRDAVRCEYRALVGDLARAGFVDEIPGRTSGEERRQVARLAPDVAARFDEAADVFDEAWFGDVVVTPDDDARFRRAAEAVLAHVGGRGPVAAGAAPA